MIRGPLDLFRKTRLVLLVLIALLTFQMVTVNAFATNRESLQSGTASATGGADATTFWSNPVDLHLIQKHVKIKIINEDEFYRMNFKFEIVSAVLTNDNRLLILC